MSGVCVGQDSTLQSFSTVHDSENRSLGRASYHKAESKKSGLREDQYMMPPIIQFASGQLLKTVTQGFANYSAMCFHCFVKITMTWWGQFGVLFPMTGEACQSSQVSVRCNAPEQCQTQCHLLLGLCRNVMYISGLWYKTSFKWCKSPAPVCLSSHMLCSNQLQNLATHAVFCSCWNEKLGKETVDTEMFSCWLLGSLPSHSDSVNHPCWLTILDEDLTVQCHSSLDKENAGRNICEQH